MTGKEIQEYYSNGVALAEHDEPSCTCVVHDNPEASFHTLTGWLDTKIQSLEYGKQDG